MLGWLIDVNLAIVYVSTNFFIKMNSQNYCHFYVRQIDFQIFKAIKKK